MPQTSKDKENHNSKASIGRLPGKYARRGPYTKALRRKPQGVESTNSASRKSREQSESAHPPIRQQAFQRSTTGSISIILSVLNQMIPVTVIWIITYTLIFIVSYYRYLQHYLLCPLTCGKGCLCLAGEPSHKSGLIVLWNQVRLIFDIEPLFNTLSTLLLATAATVNIYLLYRIYKKEKEIYAHTSLLTLLLSIVGALFGGCISCNLALIYPFLSFFGVSGLILSLPFQGKEIILISAIFLFINAYYLSKRLKRGLVGRLSYNK